MSKPQRRVRTEPVPGADPAPQRFEFDGHAVIDGELAGEDRLDTWGDLDYDQGPEVRADFESDSNDERLREGVPPHNV